MAGIVFFISDAKAEQAKYVALGSSYAAGPGVGINSYDPNPNDSAYKCSRSATNYSHILAGKLNLDLNDVTCSGATTADILDRSQHNGLTPQIDAVEADTKLVTVTIGGNDVNYVGNLMGYSCLDSGAKGCSTTVVSDADVDKRFAALKGRLSTISSEVHRRAPQATLVFTGYLPVLPFKTPAAGDTCYTKVPLTVQDAIRMENMYTRLVSLIRQVALANGDIDIRGSVVGYGHDACSPSPFTAGYYPRKTTGWPFSAAYHPNQAGMAAMADAIEQALQNANVRF